MKKMVAVLMALLVLMTCAVPGLAEVDVSLLESAEDMMVYVDDNGIDIVIRPMDQPYFGTISQEDTEIIAYLDIVELPQEHAVLARILLCTAGPEEISAREIRITEGGKTYVFDVTSHRAVTEYDLSYFEDYALCLTDLSLPLLKALARARTDEHTFLLCGDRELTATLSISGDTAARLYDLYVSAHGDKQSLDILRDVFPVIVK